RRRLSLLLLMLLLHLFQLLQQLLWSFGSAGFRLVLIDGGLIHLRRLIGSVLRIRLVLVIRIIAIFFIRLLLCVWLLSLRGASHGRARLAPRRQDHTLNCSRAVSAI